MDASRHEEAIFVLLAPMANTIDKLAVCVLAFFCRLIYAV